MSQLTESTIIFATQNEHKLEEVSHAIGILMASQKKNHSFVIKGLSGFDIRDDIPETSDTLEGNALEKARFIHNRFKINCFADDTGLEIEALGGKPGVYSARYAGMEKDAEKNMEKVLQEMEFTDDRRARFRTVIALIYEGKTYQFEGIVNGEILRVRKGNEGFGYDPIFKPNGFDKTLAEMTLDEKNKISHRYRAIKKLSEFLISLK